MRGRHLLSLLHHTEQEIHHLLDVAGDLKQAKRGGTERQLLRGRTIALIFEKTSTRTRCAFEVACYDQGAHTTFLDPSSSQLGHKESVKDTARVLGRMYDAIQYRGSAHSVVEQLAAHAGVPVFNGLTDEHHPTQALADVLTMTEHCAKPLHDVSFAFVGDGHNNVASSLLLIGSKLGMDVRIGAPEALTPSEDLLKQCQDFADLSGGRITVTSDPAAAVRGVDFVHTDVWVSMGEPAESWAERIDLCLPYRVDARLLESTGNPRVRFMHCLPAFHDTGTTVGRGLVEHYPHLREGLEVTDEVFESPANIAFDQAENRLHTIKAALVASLA
jgi:ornithine carbamoyltransferase